MNGNSIVTVTCRGVRFIDSLKFLDMKLADLPQTFGLTEMKKGYFPFPIYLILKDIGITMVSTHV